MTDSEQQLSGMSRRQSLQLGAISMLGLLTAGATQPAQAASPATATGNGAMTGDGHKLVPDQGVRVTERPKNYITPKGLKVTVKSSISVISKST